MLKLNNALVIFDLEATGLNPRHDRIVEIGAVKMMPDGTQEKLEQRLNPERSIPADAVRIHGIKNADVANCPTFADLADELYLFFNGADLAGFGIARFDIPMLRAEFSRVGIQLADRQREVIDVKDIFHKKEPRDLSAALKFYCGREHTDAHGAMPDALAALDVLTSQLERYTDLPNSVPELHKFCNPGDPDALDVDGRFRWRDGEVVLGFGQKSGRPLKQVAAQEPGFLKWMLNKDFAPDAKMIAENALRGIFPDGN